MKELKAKEYRRFEDIKQLREDGSEFWSARELAPALEYTKWENFSKVIKRAMIACENSGHSVNDDFPEVRKIVEAGATTKPVLDYELSRYACYLIVQNGDPRKEVTADADDRNTFDMEKYLNRKLKLRNNEEYTVVDA